MWFLGDVPGLPEAPPDYTEGDRRSVAAELADWHSDFEPRCATFLNPQGG